MANQCYCLVQNYYSDVAFPDHSVTATQNVTTYADAPDQADGHEVWRIADGRRSSQDYWTPGSESSASYSLTIDCGSAKTPTMVALDRGHNLAGIYLVIQGDDADDFSGADTYFSGAIASAASSGTSLTAAAGCYTEEGAWLYQFAGAAHRYWRVRISADGDSYDPGLASGVLPIVTGLYLGPAWNPGALTFPVTDQDAAVLGQVVTSDAGWQGTTYATRQQQGELMLKLPAESDWVTARAHLWEHFFLNRPMWIVHDDAYAERAVLALPQRTRFGARVDVGEWTPTGRLLSVPWIEHQPKLA